MHYKKQKNRKNCTQKNRRYLGCAEHKRSGCRARAIIPVGGGIYQLKMTQPHNHPPDPTVGEKEDFIKELKAAVRSGSMANATLKKVYETVAVVHPRGAAQVPFRSICSSLHRWRRSREIQHLMCNYCNL